MLSPLNFINTIVLSLVLLFGDSIRLSSGIQTPLQTLERKQNKGKQNRRWFLLDLTRHEKYQLNIVNTLDCIHLIHNTTINFV